MVKSFRVKSVLIQLFNVVNMSHLSRNIGVVAIVLPMLIFLLSEGVSAQNGSSAKPAPSPYVVCGTYISETGIDGYIVNIGDSVVFSDQQGTLTAIDLSSLDRIWRSEPGGKISSNIVTYGDKFFLVTNTVGESDAANKSSQLKEISSLTGLPSRSLAIPYSRSFHIKITDGGVVLVGEKGQLLLVSPDEFKTTWSLTVPAKHSVRSTVNGNIASVVDGSGNIYNISISEQRILSETVLSHKAGIIISDDKKAAFVADNIGTISKLTSQRAGIDWTFKAGAAVTNIIPRDGAVYLTSLDNFVYKLSSVSGTVIWRRRVPNRLSIPAAITDSSILVSGVGDEEIFMIDRSRGTITNRLPLITGKTVSGPPIPVGDHNIVVQSVGSIILLSEKPCTPPGGNAK